MTPIYGIVAIHVTPFVAIRLISWPVTVSRSAVRDCAVVRRPGSRSLGVNLAECFRDLDLAGQGQPTRDPRRWLESREKAWRASGRKSGCASRLAHSR